MIDQVSLVSAQQIVVGRQAGLPIPLSPLVAGILDTLANTASYNLPANVVLNQLEVFSLTIVSLSFLISFYTRIIFSNCICNPVFWRNICCLLRSF